MAVPHWLVVLPEIQTATKAEYLLLTVLFLSELVCHPVRLYLWVHLKVVYLFNFCM